MTMKKQGSKALALLTAFAVSAFSLSGCFSGSSSKKNSDPVNNFDSAKSANYYVNQKDPVCVSGNMEVYKYQNAGSATFTLGGHDYNGGLTASVQNLISTDERPEIDFLLDKAYDKFSFVVCGHGSEKSQSGKDANGNPKYYSFAYFDGLYPTVNGPEVDATAIVQILVDGKLKDEFTMKSYDPEKRCTVDVTGADKVTVKLHKSGEQSFVLHMFEITASAGDPIISGYTPSPAGDEAVMLCRDLKPYLIPSNSSFRCCAEGVDYENIRSSIHMGTKEYKYAMYCLTSMALAGTDYEKIFYNLEGKYKYLEFTAGAADRSVNNAKAKAWLQVYADNEKIFEEVFETGDLPKTFSLDVEGVSKLEFSYNFGDGTLDGDYFGIGDAYVATTQEAIANAKNASGSETVTPSGSGNAVKIISELGYFGVYSIADSPVLDGSTKLKTFSMGGEKFYEGAMLRAGNSFFDGSIPSAISFNLDGKYKAVSFYAGHIENSKVYAADQVEIYADGTLIQTIPIEDKALPKLCVVQVNSCKQLQIVSGRQTMGVIDRPAFGIANLIAYTEDYTETDLFETRKPTDYPDECDLIETVGFYGVHIPWASENEAGGLTTEDGYYDGTSKQKGFTINGEKINKGVRMYTQIHLDAASAMAGLSTVIGGWFCPMLALAGSVHDSSFALANLRGTGYTTLTFKVACLDGDRNTTEWDLMDDTSLLEVGTEKGLIKEITLDRHMQPTEYTVDISGGEQLIMTLVCDEKHGNSFNYFIYDVRLSK